MGSSLVVMYAGTFAFLWLRNPSYSRVVDGAEYRVVEYHFNRFSWSTRLVWAPGLLFMEHVVGYKDIAEVAAYDQSVITYARVK
jgi:hypothetical protein